MLPFITQANLRFLLASCLGEKIASDQSVSYALVGRLYHVNNWIMLSVPNALVRGLFQALNAPGIELPPGPDGPFNAHISVIRPEELDKIGGPDKITERGKQFTYTTGRIYEITPEHAPELSKVWALRVHSPELQMLRRSYGLSSLPHDGEYDFHITIAARRRGVLGRNATKKQEDRSVVSAV